MQIAITQVQNFFSDFKIRIKNNVLPISETYYWNYKNGTGTYTTPSTTWYIKPLDDIIHNSPYYPKAINSYFTQDGSVFDQAVADNGATQSSDSYAASQLPDFTNLDRSSQTHVPNTYIRYLYHKYQTPIEYGTTWATTRSWYINDSRGAIAHELGHSFGLLDNMPNCANNLMRQNGTGAGISKNFLTPPQIRTSHDNLTKTNLIQFVTEDSYYNVGLKITQNQTWMEKRRIYSDLIIENGANLILKKDLIMSPQSVIYIRNGGTLTLDGGLILSADGENWGGLFKNPTGNFVITTNTNSTELYANEYFIVTTNTTNKTVCGTVTVLGKESVDEEWVNIYPNPSSGNVTFEFSNDDYVGGTILIMDQMNQQVFSKKISQLKDSLNLTKLPKGIYTVVFNKNNQILNKQLIIK